MNFEIEHGVPMPQLRNKYPFEQMVVGDSFLVPAEMTTQIKTISSAASYAGKMLKVKFVTKTVDEGVRVWRTA